jgi:hypothetical protein
MKSNVTKHIETIRYKELKVDPLYQRRKDMKRVETIVKNFDPAKINLVKVSKRDGYYWIWDGQHTAEACAIYYGLKINGKFEPNPDAPIECMVFEGLSKEEEAIYFSEQDDNARSVPKCQKMKAKFVAGDPDIVRFKSFVESRGLRCDFNNHGGTDYRTISCYQTAFEIFMESEKRFEEILNIIDTVWGDRKDAYRKEVIKGLNVFIEIYGDRAKHDKLITALRRTIPTNIVRDAAQYSGSPGGKQFALVILYEYNKRQRGKAVLPKEIF